MLLPRWTDSFSPRRDDGNDVELKKGLLSDDKDDGEVLTTRDDCASSISGIDSCHGEEAERHEGDNQKSSRTFSSCCWLLCWFPSAVSDAFSDFFRGNGARAVEESTEQRENRLYAERYRLVRYIFDTNRQLYSLTLGFGSKSPRQLTPDEKRILEQELRRKRVELLAKSVEVDEELEKIWKRAGKKDSMTSPNYERLMKYHYTVLEPSERQELLNLLNAKREGAPAYYFVEEKKL